MVKKSKENQKVSTNKPNDDEPNKVTTKDATSYLYCCFRILGVYFKESNKYSYILYALFVNLSVTIFLPSSFVASYSLKSSKNFEYDTLLTSIQVAINVVGSAVKICMLMYYIPQLLATEPVLSKLDKRCTAEDEISLLYELRNLGRRLVVGFSISYWSYAASTFITSILAGHPPYSLYIPYINWRNSKREFIVASIIEWILIHVCCFQQVANDAYAALYVCILRAHVNILRLRIRKLCSKPDINLNDDDSEQLTLCIIDHKNIIQLYNIIAPVISATIFLQFTITAGILGITLINMLIFANSFSSKIASCFYVIAVVVEIFPLCYYANCLMYDSDQLSDEIFHSNWIEQSKKYRKMMIFFMQRTQQNIEFLAGKIFLINLNSFISIAKFSLSLYTLIKKMNLKEKLGLH